MLSFLFFLPQTSYCEGAKDGLAQILNNEPEAIEAIQQLVEPVQQVVEPVQQVVEPVQLVVGTVQHFEAQVVESAQLSIEAGQGFIPVASAQLSTEAAQGFIPIDGPPIEDPVGNPGGNLEYTFLLFATD